MELTVDALIKEDVSPADIEVLQKDELKRKTVSNDDICNLK